MTVSLDFADIFQGLTSEIKKSIKNYPIFISIHFSD